MATRSIEPDRGEADDLVGDPMRGREAVKSTVRSTLLYAGITAARLLVVLVLGLSLMDSRRLENPALRSR